MIEPPWLTEARKYIGITEVVGPKNNPELMALLDWADGKKDGKTLAAQNDDEAWCSKAVCAWFELVGIRSTRSPAARSFGKWGQELDGPAVGCVVVFWRKSVDGPFGHVGLVVGKDKSNNLIVLGGNQGNEVSIRAFAEARVIKGGYRWPDNRPKPKAGWDVLPLLKSDGTISENEA